MKLRQLFKRWLRIKDVVQEEDFDTVRQYSLDGRKWHNCQPMGYRYYPKYEDWKATTTKDGTKVRLIKKTL
jgi:hypothetical protein